MALSPFLLLALGSLPCLQEKWLPDIQQRGIPTTAGVGPLDMLTDESTKASAPAACAPACWAALLLVFCARGQLYDSCHV